jgi:hypothetical protein
VKHIKTYENFTDVHYKVFESSSEDIEQDLNDICLELKDSGLLDISIKHSKREIQNWSKSYFSIKIESLKGKSETLIYGKYFEFNDDIQTMVLRVNQYMRELGFRAYYMTKGYSHATNDFVVRPDEKLRYVNGLWVSNTDRVLLIELLFYK